MNVYNDWLNKWVNSIDKQKSITYTYISRIEIQVNETRNTVYRCSTRFVNQKRTSSEDCAKVVHNLLYILHLGTNIQTVKEYISLFNPSVINVME